MKSKIKDILMVYGYYCKRHAKNMVGIKYGTLKISKIKNPENFICSVCEYEKLITVRNKNIDKL